MRRKRPLEWTPSDVDIQTLLREAQPTIRDGVDVGEAAVEERRANAVRKLLAFASALLDEADKTYGWTPHPRSRFGSIPEEVREFLMRAGLRILLDDKPDAALRRFLGIDRRRRGHPFADRDRNARISIEVFRLRAGGMSVDDACEAVGKNENLSLEAVRKIHKQHRRGLSEDERMLASTNLAKLDVEQFKRGFG